MQKRIAQRRNRAKVSKRATCRHKPLDFYLLEWKSEDSSTEMYDIMRRCIVRATNVTRARQIAQAHGSDECYGKTRRRLSFWTNPKRTTCQLLSSVYKQRADEEMIIAETLDG